MNSRLTALPTILTTAPPPRNHASVAMPPRSLVIFWLLVIATLCADAAAAISVTSRHFRIGLFYSLNVWSALILAQVSVTAIWLVFRPRPDLWSWVLPPAILVAASMLRTKVGLFGNSWTTLDYGCRTALQMLLTMVVLWLSLRTSWWRRWSPAVNHLKWEYSLRQLLGWTTVVALMSAVVARATWANSQPVAVSQTVGVFAPTTIAVGVVLLATSPFHWLARLVGYLIVGAAVGLTLAKLLYWNITDRLLVEFITEALLVAAWVEWGGIIPRVTRAAHSQPSGSIP